MFEDNNGRNGAPYQPGDGSGESGGWTQGTPQGAPGSIQAPVQGQEGMGAGGPTGLGSPVGTGSSFQSWSPSYGSQPGQQRGYSNRYDPYRNRYQGVGYQPQPGQPQGYTNPYQYTPGSGWQQAPQTPQPPKKDDWYGRDYDKPDGPEPDEEKKKSRKGLVALAVGVICILSISLVGVSGYGIWSSMSGEDRAVEPPDGLVIGEEGEAETEREPITLDIQGKPEDELELPDGRLTTPQVAQKVLPAVVGVIKYENNQFRQAAGMGSGIIMTQDGYIITNAHVVSGGTGFKVETYDGTPYDAELVGLDAPTDLAVLKITAEGLTAAQFGDSSELLVGETVVAIGNPGSMTLAGSVTQGIVSAIRDMELISTYAMAYIQTDAAINPGNSGGALCNEFGQVIGINSAKIVAEGFEGIGFAIPINNARPVLEDIVAYGRVTGRVKLGITVYEIDEVDARYFDVPMGIEIQSIEPGSFLSETDAQRGDIITHINGERVVSMLEMRAELNKYQVGDVVELGLYRQTSTRGYDFTVSVQLMEDEG